MVCKTISCSFEKDSMGGFITICNGVTFGRDGHFSKTVAVTKEAFLEACKNKLLFNDILGIDIRQGWQNTLSDAIKPFLWMEPTFNPAEVLQKTSELDVKLRGVDAVQADIDALEKQNDELDKEIKKAKPKGGKKVKEKPVADEKPAEPEKTATPLQEEPKPQESAENVVAEDVAQPEESKTEEVEDGNGRNEATDNVSENTGSEVASELSADTTGTSDNE